MVFTKPQLNVLSLGLNFKTPQKKLNKIQTKIEFENLCDQFKDLSATSADSAGWLCATMVDILHTFLSAPIRQQTGLKAEHYKAIQGLRMMSELKFLKPDKGSGVVIMTKESYKEKMNRILSDDSKFKADKTPDNGTLTEKMITRKLQILLLHGYIAEAQYKNLKPLGTGTLQMRCSSKIHKACAPLSPILCMQNSLYHKVARWLVDILDLIRKALTPHCIKLF
ncbi:unnamed protein product [Echinostoma caproni]|uniref:General transcription factor 3C polypeptide 1 n=1 Tax=Echinostoma caproni TaxID=27848 RepID=A0A183AK92_9TREM|nr:unnamed protein product [Echinostoma caproni]